MFYKTKTVDEITRQLLFCLWGSKASVELEEKRLHYKFLHSISRQTISTIKHGMDDRVENKLVDVFWKYISVKQITLDACTR